MSPPRLQTREHQAGPAHQRHSSSLVTLQPAGFSSEAVRFSAASDLLHASFPQEDKMLGPGSVVDVDDDDFKHRAGHSSKQLPQKLPASQTDQSRPEFQLHAFRDRFLVAETQASATLRVPASAIIDDETVRCLLLCRCCCCSRCFNRSV